MDRPENYYAILGVPLDADIDTLKRAYRQLARRYHPDLAGSGGEIEMKRINRAYAVLSDPEKRRNYDSVIGGGIDLRRARTRVQPHVFDPTEDVEFSGLNIFSTHGPLSAGPVISTHLGVISALSCVHTVQGIIVAAGSLDGRGAFWSITDKRVAEPVNFVADAAFTVESLRELRFSRAGALLAGWGRSGLHVWDGVNGTRLWSYSLQPRAVSAHYSLDVALSVVPGGKRLTYMALPLLVDDVRAPRAWGVRGTDVVSHEMGTVESSLSEPLVCTEEGVENRQFWAIRLRALSQDARLLVTLSCAHLPNDQQEIAIVRRWNLEAKTRLGKVRPQIVSSIVVGRCAECGPPYAATPDGKIVAFVQEGRKLRLCDTVEGTYNELLSGVMGGSSRLALSPDGEWAAIAREDSEVNEGVIDLWSVRTGQVIQKLYHPWQVSALHFAGKQLLVALTDGTIQIWQ
ncbi:MAG: DnaJ domain-containing protein [Ktedonobacteraceae bacterium]|nr:DnaJ domain-containing protein [Ktedonobacteraceae bacterium]